MRTERYDQNVNGWEGEAEADVDQNVTASVRVDQNLVKNDEMRDAVVKDDKMRDAMVNEELHGDLDAALSATVKNDNMRDAIVKDLMRDAIVKDDGDLHDKGEKKSANTENKNDTEEKKATG